MEPPPRTSEFSIDPVLYMCDCEDCPDVLCPSGIFIVNPLPSSCVVRYGCRNERHTSRDTLLDVSNLFGSRGEGQ